MIKGVKELYKDVNPEVIEKERQRLIETHVEGYVEYLNNLDELLLKIAGVDPIQAIKLEGLAKSQSRMKDIKLDTLSSDERLYNFALELIENLYPESMKRLETIILRLSRQKNIFFWFRMKSYFKKVSPLLDEWGEYTKGILEGSKSDV